MSVITFLAPSEQRLKKVQEYFDLAENLERQATLNGEVSETRAGKSVQIDLPSLVEQASAPPSPSPERTLAIEGTAQPAVAETVAKQKSKRKRLPAAERRRRKKAKEATCSFPDSKSKTSVKKGKETKKAAAIQQPPPKKV